MTDDRLRLPPYGAAGLHGRCASMMPLEPTSLLQGAWLMLGGLLFVAGGLRFRRWVVEDRPGIPKYSPRVETVMLWLVYSGVVSFAIVVIKQTLRHI